jgi:tRNA(fMet)-specific endonuclease VapC
MTGDKSAIIDTNIIIELFEGNKLVADFIDSLAMLYIPAIVLGEMYFGANLSDNELKKVKQIES